MYMIEHGLCNYNSDTHNRIYSLCEELIRQGQNRQEVFEQVGSQVGLGSKSVERVYYLLRQPVPDHIASAFESLISSSR